MKMLFLTAVVFSLFSILAPFAYAIPGTFSHQGYLTDAAGAPIDGTVDMVLSLYDVSSGGTPLWTDTKTVTVTKGVYTVTLGAPTHFNLPFDAQYFLGVTVGSDLEMTPRIRLRSAPYSLTSKKAESIIADSVGSAEVIDESLTANDLATGSVTASEIAVDAVTASAIAQDAVGLSEINGTEVAVYEVPFYCENPREWTFDGTACLSMPCGGPSYYDCLGNCSSPSALSCQKTLKGYLLSPTIQP